MSKLRPEDQNAIRHLLEEHWTAAGLARDWDKSLAICAQNVEFMVPDQPVVRGHEALRAWLDRFPTLLKFTQHVDEVEGQDNKAVSRATFALTIDNAGTPVENTGKGLVVWEKNASGQWIFNAACFNWDRPMGASA
jgi:ketosteroid isomerase-like protein